MTRSCQTSSNPFQFFPSRGMALVTKLLPHLPILVHPRRAKFYAVVAHGEIDIVDGIHQEAMLVLGLGYKEISLDGIVRDKPAQHDTRFFIGLTLLEKLIHQSGSRLYQFMGKGD